MRNTFDYEYWKAKIPLAAHRAERQRFLDNYVFDHMDELLTPERLKVFIKDQLPSGGTITGPFDIAIMEQLREEKRMSYVQTCRVLSRVTFLSCLVESQMTGR